MENTTKAYDARYFANLDAGERPRVRSADDADDLDEYSADCPACLRGRAHTDSEHERALDRAREDAAEAEGQRWADEHENAPCRWWGGQ